MIVICKCKHAYQDSIYGTQKRHANLATKSGGYRCTVCGTLHKSDDLPKKKESK